MGGRLWRADHGEHDAEVGRRAWTLAQAIPESWTSNPVRLKRAGVPVEHRAARTKSEIGLAEIDRVIASGVRFGCVLADSGYGSSGPFRQALSERGLLWAVGLSRRQNVYPADIALIFPIAKTGMPRKSVNPPLESRKERETEAQAPSLSAAISTATQTRKPKPG